MLGLLVFVHELGHFLAAKSVGVAVEEFAFGFGPRLVTLFRRSGTEYTIHALPLGGFVNLVGMQPEEVHLENGLMSKPAWARAFVFLAGPAMNLLLAILILCSMGVVTGIPVGRSNEVVEVHPDTEAAKVGLRTGDRIVALDGRRLASGNELIEAIESHPGQPVTLTVERDGAEIQVPARPMPELQLVPHILVEQVEPGGPAEKLGFRPRDRVVAVNSQPVESGLEISEALDGKEAEPFTMTVQRGTEQVPIRVEGELQGLTMRADVSPLAKRLGLQLSDRIDAVNGRKLESATELAAALETRAGQPVTLSVERDGEVKELPARPVPVALAAPDQLRTVGKMGFLPGYRFRKMSFADSVNAGWQQFLTFFTSLYGLVESGRLGKSAGSIFTMYRATEMYNKLSPGYMVNLVAQLSLSLAVFNLLPIPILDGGHLALLSIEVIRRRRLGPGAYRLANAIGFAVVIVAFVLLMYFDVVRWRAGTPLINL
jgi:regulator of sigma E protease